MQALLALTRANIRSYTRDRAALFWTLAFPLIFIFMFGLIFQGGGTSGLSIGWADEDGSGAATSLRETFDGLDGITVRPAGGVPTPWMAPLSPPQITRRRSRACAMASSMRSSSYPPATARRSARA